MGCLSCKGPIAVQEADQIRRHTRLEDFRCFEERLQNLERVVDLSAAALSRFRNVNAEANVPLHSFGGKAHGDARVSLLDGAVATPFAPSETPTSWHSCREELDELQDSEELETSTLSEKPNFTGVWKMERAERLQEFLIAVGHSWVISRAAPYVKVFWIIEQQGDEIRLTTQVANLPSPFGDRRTSIVKVGSASVPVTDDTGRETLLLNPCFKGKVFHAGVRFANLPHAEITSERSLVEDDLLLEHVKYPAKGIEMRRYFRRHA